MSEEIKVGDWVKYRGLDEEGQVVGIAARALAKVEFFGSIKGRFEIALLDNLEKCSPPEQNNPWLPASEMVEGVEYECDYMDCGGLIFEIDSSHIPNQKSLWIKEDGGNSRGEDVSAPNPWHFYTTAKFRRIK